MVKLFVILRSAHLPCGEFKNEAAAIKWFMKNKHSFQDNDGSYGDPVTVQIPRRRT